MSCTIIFSFLLIVEIDQWEHNNFQYINKSIRFVHLYHWCIWQNNENLIVGLNIYIFVNFREIQGNSIKELKSENFKGLKNLTDL